MFYTYIKSMLKDRVFPGIPWTEPRQKTCNCPMPGASTHEAEGIRGFARVDAAKCWQSGGC